MEDSQGLLPAGWIIEIKTRKNGSQAGKCYKCYIDLLTGRKFYSKEAVSRYLKSRKLDSEKSGPRKQRKINCEASKSKNKRKLDSETYKSKNLRKLGSETSKPKNKRKLNSETSKPKKKRKLNGETSKPKKKRKLDGETSGPKNKKTYTPCPDNVASQNESWPDCLPPGWTKEIKYRNRIGAGFRRDMYYTDPVTGFIFRSKVDVLRYLETGELGKDAKPKKQSISNTRSIGNKFSSPVAAKQEKSGRRVAAKQEKSARRCLFDSDRLNSDGKTTEKIGTSPLGVQGESGHSKRRQSERIQAAQIMEKESPELEDGKQPSKSLENGLPLEYEDNHQQQPETRVLSKLEDKKLLKNAVPMESEDKKLQTNGWTLECKDKKLSENVGPSESEGMTLLEDGLLLKSVDKNPLSKDKLPENGPLLKSAGKKLLKNAALLKSTKKKLGKRELMKSKNKKQMDTGPQMESVDKKQKDTGPRMEAKDEKPLDDGLVNANEVPPESEEKKLKRELMKSKDKKQMDTGLQMESVDKKQKDTGPRMEAKDEKPLDDGLANANKVPPESEEKKLKRELMKSKDKKQMDTGPQMESVDKKQKDTGPRMEAKDAKPLDVGLANANKVPPESEEKKLLQNEVEKREAKSTRAHSRKAKAGKVSILPQRASKRLAGLEANLVVFQNPDLACRLATKQKVGPAPPASGATEACQTGKVEAEKPTVIEAEKPIPDEAEKPADGNVPQSPLVLPFGDSWPDPCLEFAFKTLTGDIPMDTLEIEGYFQQQLGMAQPQSPGCDSLFEPQVLLGPSNGSLPCFLENELPANGGKERERNAKGKN
ncbi:methyl-CpG-binding domain-containing protein 13 isoform X2 [Magnolia sinica]|uniref:methyl-CpG-binding domain-containing protein 13 isoform X2 n=1 Tax=Magnolia sinica TaxID=86752 RepID=UPI002658FB2E|nr:methyl-CpG-binding domain-containing protein 13 isoform X2 [Magnolia sinica]